MTDPNKLKEEINSSITKRKYRKSYAAILELLDNHYNHQHASFASKKLGELNSMDFTRVKIAILSFETLQPLIPHLICELARVGLSPDFYFREYEPMRNEIHNPHSKLYSFNPKMIFLAFSIKQFSEGLANSAAFLDLKESQIRREMKKVIDGMETDITSLREQTDVDVPIVVHNFLRPAYPARGIADVGNPFSHSETVAEINRRLTQVAAKFTNVYVLDYDGFAFRHGKNIGRARGFENIGLYLSPEGLKRLAVEQSRFILPYFGRTRKVLVMDADNTLWQGIVSEDGIHAVQPFTEFQKALLAFKKRGILLALNSRNDESFLTETFKKLATENKAMVLHLDDFAAYRINHGSKAENCRQIAQELNVGIESLVVVDDNEHECAEVRARYPEIRVIRLPKNQRDKVDSLLELPDFEALYLTEEAQRRSEMYREQRKREASQKAVMSHEEWLASLDIHVTVRPAQAGDVTRIEELTKRTNQFNVTGISFPVATINELRNSSAAEILVGEVTDRFGDFGRVMTAIIDKSNSTCWIIKTFCLSCRAMGKGVETACLADIINRARAKKASELRGRMIPNNVNKPGQQFYPKHGFAKGAEQKDGSVVWSINLSSVRLTVPDWIKLTSLP